MACAKQCESITIIIIIISIVIFIITIITLPLTRDEAHESYWWRGVLSCFGDRTKNNPWFCCDRGFSASGTPRGGFPLYCRQLAAYNTPVAVYCRS